MGEEEEIHYEQSAGPSWNGILLAYFNAKWFWSVIILHRIKFNFFTEQEFSFRYDPQEVISMMNFNFINFLVTI